MKHDKKIRVGILFGGKSAEHEVSVMSARSIVEALDTAKFTPVLIGIDKQGKWHLNQHSAVLTDSTGSLATENSSEMTLLPGNQKRELVSVTAHEPAAAVDVVFPIVHGPLAEDGTIQGFLELANVPYVGAGVLGSAVGMDKDVMKRLLRDAGIPVTKFRVVKATDRSGLDAQSVGAELGWPVFVKPANMGSSVGVSKAQNAEELAAALDKAFRYDRKVLIETAVVGDEVECAVLGNDTPEASVPGRIIPSEDFYTYNAKYQDENGTVLEIPAALSDDVARKVQRTAIKTFQALGCEGLARVDMFVDRDGAIVMNEINTMPGFTRLSMYPRLWEASGLSYTDLITKLIELAIERHERQQHLQTAYGFED